MIIFFAIWIRKNNRNINSQIHHPNIPGSIGSQGISGLTGPQWDDPNFDLIITPENSTYSHTFNNIIDDVEDEWIIETYGKSGPIPSASFINSSIIVNIYFNEYEVSGTRVELGLLKDFYCGFYRLRKTSGFNILIDKVIVFLTGIEDHGEVTVDPGYSITYERITSHFEISPNEIIFDIPTYGYSLSLIPSP